VFLEQGLGTAPDGWHPRRHSLIAAIETPELGEHVFYWQERADGKTGPVLRQRLLVISADEQALGLQMALYPLVDPERHIDLQDQPSDVQGRVEVKRDTMTQCMLTWKREIGQLRGYSNEPCQFMQPNRKPPLPADITWSLSADELWILEGETAEPDLFPIKYFKTRHFECYLSIELGEEQRFVENPFFLHDRGDHAVFSTGVNEPAEARVVLRRSMWPSRSGRNFVELLRVILFFDNNETPAGMGWATPESGRVGFGTERAQARCKLIEPPVPTR
jgi:hypothetical protein